MCTTILCIVYGYGINRKLLLPFSVPIIGKNTVSFYVINGFVQAIIASVVGYTLCFLDTIFIFFLNFLISQFFLVKICFIYFDKNFESFEITQRIAFLKKTIYIHNRAIKYIKLIHINIIIIKYHSHFKAI